MGNSLARQRAVVVGGSSGMGLAVCAQLMRLRCEVLIMGRSRDKLEKARERLREFGEPRLHRADMARSACRLTDRSS